MKILTLGTLLICFMFTSCSDDDNTTPLLEVASKTVSNLNAPQVGGRGQAISGEFTKFNFATGQSTTSDTDWDIAFRGTSIIVNGGTSLGTTDEPVRTGIAAAYIESGTLASVTEVDLSLLTQDSANGYAINGWYSLDTTTYILSALAGKIIVVKTHDGNYAKLEILSYYKDLDTSKESRYYTFNYVYQPNEGVTTF